MWQEKSKLIWGLRTRGNIQWQDIFCLLRRRRSSTPSVFWPSHGNVSKSTWTCSSFIYKGSISYSIRCGRSHQERQLMESSTNNKWSRTTLLHQGKTRKQEELIRGTHITNGLTWETIFFLLVPWLSSPATDMEWVVKIGKRNPLTASCQAAEASLTQQALDSFLCSQIPGHPGVPPYLFTSHPGC